LFVCLFINRITQEETDDFSRNLGIKIYEYHGSDSESLSLSRTS